MEKIIAILTSNRAAEIFANVSLSIAAVLVTLNFAGWVIQQCK